MLTFADDFSDVEVAARMPLREVIKSYDNLKKGLEQAEKELEVSHNPETLDTEAKEFADALGGFCRSARHQLNELEEESQRLQQTASRLAE
jgi:hypothetical protein